MILREYIELMHLMQCSSFWTKASTKCINSIWIFKCLIIMGDVKLTWALHMAVSVSTQTGQHRRISCDLLLLSPLQTRRLRVQITLWAKQPIRYQRLTADYSVQSNMSTEGRAGGRKKAQGDFLQVLWRTCLAHNSSNKRLTVHTHSSLQCDTTYFYCIYNFDALYLYIMQFKLLYNNKCAKNNTSVIYTQHNKQVIIHILFYTLFLYNTL